MEDSGKVGILMMGLKGLRTLGIMGERSPHLFDKIEFIVVGEDLNVVNDYSAEIREFCKDRNILVFERSVFPEMTPNSKWLIAISWKWLLDITQWNVIVLHDSLLPNYRGFNPLVTALIAGDREIGVTAIEANDKIDQGDIYCQVSLEIEYPIKIQQAIEKISDLYGEIVIELLSKDLGTIQKTVQNEKDATYSLWRNDEDYFIDWNEDSDKICRQIDAVGYPYLGACTIYKDKRIRLIDAVPRNDLTIVNRVPGKIFSIIQNKPLVVCGKGLVEITRACDEEGNTIIFDKLRVRLQ